MEVRAGNFYTANWRFKENNQIKLIRMYKIELTNFFTYSFSIDCLIFGYQLGIIHVLHIKRSIEPYDNMWAILGDLVYPDEDLPNAAERILHDLTCLKNVDLHQAQTPRNRISEPHQRQL